ncbi:hypothetical protein LSCM4_02559 [Leishmania orientalis]|uniref:Uncharacterized protein n=1 Tax=Leishmania orientalis TaxID=2249476 RepID=A0A836KCX6_9TRYP|nr:hypothetical protein LSCM4_02559 [Leishmania orientalis]
MEEAPSTPLTPAFATTTTSTVVSSVKRPYQSADDTLPSPPPPPFCSHEPRALFCAALSATPPSSRWMLSENTVEGEVDEHGSQPKRVETEISSMLSAWGARSRCRRGQAAVLVSPAPADDSTDATPRSVMASAEGREGSPWAFSTTSEPEHDGLLHITAAALMTRQREEAISSQPSRSLMPSAAALSRAATLQPSEPFPTSAAKLPPSTSQPASSLIPGSSSPATKFGGGGAHSAPSTPTPNDSVKVLPLPLQQGERATASQPAVGEGTRMENEDLRRQLGTLLRIQEELERRCQQREGLTALEKEQALAQLRKMHEEELQELRDAETVAQSNADALAEEVVMLRSELAEVQDELRASMEQQLKYQRQSDEARNEQARMAAEYAAAELQAERSAEVIFQLSELRKKLWAAEERAAAAELALQSLCDQLAAAAAAAEATVAVEGTGEQVAHTPVRDASADAKPMCCSRASGFLSSGAQAAVTAGLFDEAAVLAAVISAMEKHGVSGVLFPSPKPSSRREVGGEAELPHSDSNATAKSIKLPISQHQRAETVPRPLADASIAPMQAHLSNAGLLHCRQHRKSMQVAMARVSDGYQRVAREAAAAANARAAKAGHALSGEVEALGVRLQQSQLLLPPYEGNRQDNESTNHERESAGCQTAQSDLQCRSSVGVVTDAVGAFSVDAPRAAAAASCYDASAATGAYEESLAETQRQLRHERSYIDQLEKELQSLRTSSYGASVLEGLSKIVQDMRLAVCRLIRDAVADVQRIAVQDSQKLQTAVISDDDHRGELVWRDDAGLALRGRWHTMNEDTRYHMSSTSPARQSDGVHRTTPALPASAPLLDFAFVRAVQKSILRAEAHVQQVSATLLSSCQRAAADACTLSGAYETGAPYRPLRMPFSAKDLADDSQRGANGLHEEAPSRRPVENDGTSFGGGKQSLSPSIPFTAAPGKGSAHQQRVYAELRGLLQRLSSAEDGVTACTPAPSSSTPEEFRRLSRARPPQTRPLGLSASLACQPSPYVAAYVVESAEVRREALSCLARGCAAGPVRVSADGRLGFALLTDAIQELRNVGRLLGSMRDAEETREARWQQYMQKWQDAIVAAVDRVWERVDSALTLVRRPEMGGEGLPCYTVELAKASRVLSPLMAMSLSICADPADNKGAQARQRPDAQLSFMHDKENSAVTPHQPSRLAEVLSGKIPSKAGSGAVLYA